MNEIMLDELLKKIKNTSFASVLNLWYKAWTNNIIAMFNCF